MEIQRIVENWGFREIEIIEQFHPDSVRKIVHIFAEGQHYLLKGIPDSVPESEIQSNVSAHRYLGNELKIAPEIYRTCSGKFYIHAAEYWFYVMEFIEGRSMLPTAKEELLLGKLARKLHSCSLYEVKSPMCQNTDRFYDWFEEREFKKEFDQILDSLPDFALYDQCMIHSDLGPHNAMIRNSGEAVLIDLDCAGIGSRFMDLGWAFIMQFVNFDRMTGEMQYAYDLAEGFLEGYCGGEQLTESEYDLIWQGAIYMHIAYMQSYGPDAVDSLWSILKFGIAQKEVLWNRLQNKKFCQKGR